MREISVLLPISIGIEMQIKSIFQIYSGIQLQVNHLKNRDNRRFCCEYGQKSEEIREENRL